MSETEKTSTSLHLKQMFGGTDLEALKREEFYRENFPSIEELTKKGVRFYQISAQEILGNKKETLIETFQDAAIVCQLGDDRSKNIKLLLIDLEGNPALTDKDKKALAQRSPQNPNPRVGMSWSSLATRIDEGSVSTSGQLEPDGFNKPIKRVIGFVDAGGARKWDNADLSDVDLFSKWVNHLCKNQGLEKLDLEVFIVEGTSLEIDKEIAIIRGL